MHKEVKKTRFRQVIGAGALLGLLGLAGLDAAQAQERIDGGRSQRGRNNSGRRVEQPGQSIYGVRQVQNEAAPAPGQEQPFERADDKERTFEEPGGAQGTSAPDSSPAGPEQSFEKADDKEKAPEEPASAWTLTELFTDECGNNTLKDWGIKISGHSAWGYSNAPDGSFVGNGPFINQQEWGQFNAEQQYLYIEKVADGKKGIDWGFRFDTLYGVDGNDAQAFGNVNPGHYDYLNGFDHGAFEWAFPQAYGEVAMGDLSVKLGHFYTLVGYEVVPTTGNFFYSKQLNFWNSEPFTHTGALATYKANDKLNVMAGWVLGWDTGFYQYNQGNAFLGGLTYQIDPKTTFVYSMVGGNLGWRGQGAVNSFVLSRHWTEKFDTVHQFDVLATNLAGADFADPASFTPQNSTGFINYAFYHLTPKIMGGVRYEWYKADGISYNTFTYGLNFKPTSNLIIRPEVRTMWSPGNQNIYTGVHGYSGTLFNQTVFGIDAIVTF